LIANDIVPGAKLPPAIGPVVYGVLSMVIPVMLLRVSRREYFGAAKPDEAVRMMLGAQRLR
jgi:hypothetical protein